MKNLVALVAAFAFAFISFSANAACSDITAEVTMQSSEDATTMTFTFYATDHAHPYFYNDGILVPEYKWKYGHRASDVEYFTFELEDGKVLITAENERCIWTLPRLPEGDERVEVKGVAKKK